MVTLEAQRVGCIPVVNNSFTSVPMLIENSVNGYAVRAFDNMAFAKTLSTLMEDVELRNRMSKQAIDNAKQFSLDEIYAQWIGLFNMNHERFS